MKIARGDVVEEPLELATPAVVAASPTIPYPFARRFGVVLDGDAEHPMIAMREGGDPKVLIELRRHLGRPFDITFVTAEAFDIAAGVSA